MIIALREKGVDVCGTTKDFGIAGEGIWISGSKKTEVEHGLTRSDAPMVGAHRVRPNVV